MSRIKVSELTELTTPSSNTEKTFILVTDVSSGSPVSKKMSIRVLDSLIDISVNAANAALANANAAFVQANSAFTYQNATASYANSGLSFANSAGSYANSAFVTSNSSFAAQNATASYANSGLSFANSAGSYANAGFGAANTADAKATSAGSYANSAFINSNSAYQSQNTTGSYANSAYVRANNSLNANVGGLITGDVSIQGSLTVTGATTYVNTQTVLVADNILTLNAAISQSGTPITNAGIEVDRGALPNVYVLWNETLDRWTFTEDGTNYDYLGSTSASSYANSAFVAANSSFAAQNATASYANSAFISANSSFNAQNATASYTNSAFLQANSSFTYQNATASYANSAFVAANAAYIRANNSLDANVGGSITGVTSFIYGAPSTSNSTGTITVVGGIGVSGNVFTNKLGLSNVQLDSTQTSSNTGLFEYYKNSVYGTVDNTQGRGFIPVVQYRYLTSNASTAISTAPLPFMGNSKGIVLSANSVYEIEWNAFFSKQTTATVGFALRFGANPQMVNVFYLGGRAELGQDVEHPGPANSAAVLSASFDPVWLFTPVAGDGSTNYFHIKALVITNSSSSANCYLQANTNGGTMTPRIGSYMKVTKLPDNETGIYS